LLNAVAPGDRKRVSGTFQRVALCEAEAVVRTTVRGVAETGIAAWVFCVMAAGCSHPCGYVDLRTEVTPIGGGETVRLVPAVRPLRVVKDLSSDNHVLEVSVERLEVTIGPARRDIYGRATRAVYRWYAPVVKPAVAGTLVLPLFFSFRDPHRHDDLQWSPVDVFMDAASWLNPFSAVPVGPREIAAEETYVRTDYVDAPVSEKPVPVSGHGVVLWVDDEKIAEATTGENGIARFDLTAHVDEAFAARDRRFKLKSMILEGPRSELRWTVTKGTLLGRPDGK